MVGLATVVGLDAVVGLAAVSRKAKAVAQGSRLFALFLLTRTKDGPPHGPPLVLLSCHATGQAI